MPRKKYWRKGLAAKNNAWNRLTSQRLKRPKVKVKDEKFDSGYEKAVLGEIGSDFTSDEDSDESDDIAREASNNSAGIPSDGIAGAPSNDVASAATDDANKTTSHDMNNSTSDITESDEGDDVLFVKKEEYGDDGDDNCQFAAVKALKFRRLDADLFKSLIQDKSFLRKLSQNFEDKHHWKRFELLDLLKCAAKNFCTYGAITRWDWAHMLNGVTKSRYRKYTTVEGRRRTLEVLKWIVKYHRDLVIEWKDGFEPEPEPEPEIESEPDPEPEPELDPEPEPEPELDPEPEPALDPDPESEPEQEPLPEPTVELCVWSDDEAAMETEKDEDDMADEEFVIVKAEQDEPLNCSGESGFDRDIVKYESLNGLHIKTEEEEVYKTEMSEEVPSVVAMTTEIDADMARGQAAGERFFLDGQEIFLSDHPNEHTMPNRPPDLTTDKLKPSDPSNGADSPSYCDLSYMERAVLETAVGNLPSNVTAGSVVEMGMQKTRLWNRIAAKVNLTIPGRHWTAEQLFKIWSRKLIAEYVDSKNIKMVVNCATDKTTFKSNISKEKSDASPRAQYSIQARNSLAVPSSADVTVDRYRKGELTPEESRVLHEQIVMHLNKLGSSRFYIKMRSWSTIARKVNEVDSRTYRTVRELKKVWKKELKKTELRIARSTYNSTYRIPVKQSKFQNGSEVSTNMFPESNQIEIDNPECEQITVFNVHPQSPSFTPETAKSTSTSTTKSASTRLCLIPQHAILLRSTRLSPSANGLVSPSANFQTLHKGEVALKTESSLSFEQTPLVIGQPFMSFGTGMHTNPSPSTNQEILPSTNYQNVQNLHVPSLTENHPTLLPSLQQSIGQPDMNIGVSRYSTSPMSPIIQGQAQEATTELVLYQLAEDTTMVKLSVTVPKECIFLRLLDAIPGINSDSVKVKEELADDAVFTADQYKVLIQLIQRKIDGIKLTCPTVVSLVLNAKNWKNLVRLVNTAGSSNVHSVPNVKNKVQTIIKILNDLLRQKLPTVSSTE